MAEAGFSVKGRRIRSGGAKPIPVVRSPGNTSKTKPKEKGKEGKKRGIPHGEFICGLFGN